MTTNFPNSIQNLSLTRGSENDTMGEDGKNHILHHQIEDDTIESVQNKVGVDNSTDKNCIDFMIRGKPYISTDSKNFKAGLNKSIDKATGDISKTTEGWIEHEKYGHYLYVQNGNISTRFDSNIKKTGRLSLKLSTINTTGQGMVYSRQPTTDSDLKYGIPINPNTKYKFGCWVKTFNAATNSVFLTISCRNTDGSLQTLTVDSGKLSGTNDWTFLYINFTTTSNCARLTYELKNIVAGNISDVWFDINSMVLQQIVENTTNMLLNPSSSILNLKGTSITNSTDQSQLTVATGRGLGRTSQQKLAQQFLPKKSLLSGITFRKNDNVGNFTGDITISIQTDNNNEPSGVKIASYKISNYVWNNISKSINYYIDLPCLLTADGLTKYWIIFESSTIDDSNYVVIRANASSYTDGLYKEYSGSSWVAQNIDLYFKTNYLKRTTGFEISEHNKKIDIKTNEDGILNGAIIDLQNNKYIFEIKPSNEILANQYANILYSASYGGRLDSLLKINGWTWQINNGGEFASETGNIERQAIVKINTGFPINHLKITSKFGFTSSISYMNISLDGINWRNIDTHTDFQESICKTDFTNGETTFYIQFLKDSSVNSYFYISNLKIEADINTSSVPVLYNYPTNQELYGSIIKSLTYQTNKVYLRLSKYGFPAFEYVDASDNYIDHEYLPIDISDATNTSDSTYIKFIENGGSTNNKYGDGEYILLSTTTNLPVIDFTIKFDKNRILVGSNNTNGISTKDGSGSGSISYMNKTQGIKYDIQDTNLEINKIKTNFLGIKKICNIVSSGELLKIGNYSLWIDCNGSLRIILGNPISDTSGTVVGVQS